MPSDRQILHIDMDAFFASVEQLDHPELRGKPVLVGGTGPRGVVAAASYEARVFGCHSAQPTAQARRLCPQAIVVRGNFARYRELSHQLRDILHRYSPAVEPISIDEAFVDLTGSERLLGPAEKVAAELKQRVKRELELTASVGLAPNKFLAKLASDLQKPDGLTIIRPGEIDAMLLPLSVTRIWGVGAKTAKSLERAGIRTIADLRNAGIKWLSERFGEAGEHYYRLSLGQDQREVQSDRDAKSIGHEETFGENLVHIEEIMGVLLGQVEKVASRVRAQSRKAGSISLKIRFGNFQTITRAVTMPQPTDSTREMWEAAKSILQKWADESFSPVRLIGVQAQNLSDGGEQMALFVDESAAKQTRLDRALDSINGRLGKAVVTRGGTVKRRSGNYG
jgi:DNA polymerase-4